MIVRLHSYLAFCVSQLWSFIVIYWQLNDYQMTIECPSTLRRAQCNAATRVRLSVRLSSRQSLTPKAQETTFYDIG